MSNPQLCDMYDPFTIESIIWESPMMDSDALLDDRAPLDSAVLPILSRPISLTPTWILESERQQYFRKIEEPEATTLVMAYGESREISLAKLTLPICDWSSQPSHATDSWMQNPWMQLGHTKPQPDFSQLHMEDRMPTIEQVTLPPTPKQNLKFIPRPAAEYDAIMKGVNTGHHDYRTLTMSEPATAAFSHATVISLQEDQATPQLHQTMLKRKRPEDPKFVLDTPKKRIRLENSPRRGSQRVSRKDECGILPLPSVFSQLIGKKRHNSRHKIVGPWGLQRIVTHAFVEQQAAKLGMMTPTVTDADVHLYCFTPKSPIHPIRSTVPPENIDIRFLRSIEISAEELLSFFPQHLKWHDAMYRLVQNGWTATDMAHFMNHARGWTNPDAQGFTANTLLKWLQAADKDILGAEKSGSTGRNTWKTTCFTTKGWVPCQHSVYREMFDYFLVDLAGGVMHWPEGDGARLLTRAVRHAVIHGNRNVKLSQIQQYLRANLLIFPPLLPLVTQMVEGEHLDKVAQLRARNEHKRRKVQGLKG
jgi:hypothetical protein